MTSTPTTDATIGHPIDLTIDPLELSAGAVDRLLADVLRGSLSTRLGVAVVALRTSGAFPRDWPAHLAEVARDHYAQYVVVDVGLSTEQLDTIVAPATRHEPMVTLRDELRETMRMAAAEILAKHAALLS